MLLLRVLGFQKGPHDTAEAYGVAWSRARTAHAFVFVTIESAIVLGAIWVAVQQRPESGLLWLLDGAGYMALGVYLLTAIRFGLASWFEDRGWSDHRVIGSWVFNAISAGAAFLLPYFMSNLVAEVIEANLLP